MITGGFTMPGIGEDRGVDDREKLREEERKAQELKELKTLWCSACVAVLGSEKYHYASTYADKVVMDYKERFHG